MSAPGTEQSPMRVAVVGSGPAGFYAAEALFAHPELQIEVDMVDRLPTPFGLVRFGVAPDHPKIKNVIRRYEKTAGHDSFRFFGNVAVGTDVTAAELRDNYNAVVWAYGAAADRKLGIEGEDLPGSHSATDFVAWYNGHPDYASNDYDLSAERVVVIGNGNVAADVARMLVLTPDELHATDTADHAIEALTSSGVRDVLVLGRRGAAQAAFTNPEVRELGELVDADIEIDPEAVVLDEASQSYLDSDAANVTKTKNMTSFNEFAAREPEGKSKRVELRFCRSPIEIQGDGKVERILLGVNELALAKDGSVKAVPTGHTELINCGMVLRSIGYKGTSIEGVPYDGDRGIVPNEAGRVLAEDGSQLDGDYVVGWIKRGPSGVIGTNKKDAAETVASLFADADAGGIPDHDCSEQALPQLLSSRGVDYVEYDGWRAIDQLETSRGEPHGRPRVKMTDVSEMVAAARKRDGSA